MVFEPHTGNCQKTFSWILSECSGAHRQMQEVEKCPRYNVYTLRLDQRFILLQCLDICTEVFPHDLAYLKPSPEFQRRIETDDDYSELVQQSKALRVLSLAELQRRLASGTYLTSARINRRDFSISAAIAKRIHMQQVMDDPALPEVIAYWLDLTTIKHRPLRHSATALLFGTVFEILSQFGNSMILQTQQSLRNLVQHIWAGGLQRACVDVDIYLRARCLKLAGKCCSMFPQEFWAPATADIFLQGACDETKTVRTEALRQLANISKNTELAFDSEDVSDAWVNVFLMYARKQHLHHTDARHLGLIGLEAMCIRRNAPVIPMDTAQSLLMLCLSDHEPLDTIIVATKLVWFDSTDEAAFKVVFENPLKAIGELEILGKALGTLEPESFVKCVLSTLDQNEDLEETQLRIICGSSEVLSDRSILQLARGLLGAKTSGPQEINELRHHYAMRLLEKVSNKKDDAYYEVLILATNTCAPHNQPESFPVIGMTVPVRRLRSDIRNVRTLGLQMHPPELATKLLRALERNSSDSLLLFKMLIASLNESVNLDVSDLQIIIEALVVLYRAVCARKRRNCRVLKFPHKPLYSALHMAIKNSRKKLAIKAVESSLRLLEDLDVLGENS